jgi:hypothetical protein
MSLTSRFLVGFALVAVLGLSVLFSQLIHRVERQYFEAVEEPMVDVVEVPPGLDPEGHYYRPAHEEVVEIRQGRWQYYKKPSR